MPQLPRRQNRTSMGVHTEAAKGVREILERNDIGSFGTSTPASRKRAAKATKNYIRGERRAKMGEQNRQNRSYTAHDPTSQMLNRGK